MVATRSHGYTNNTISRFDAISCSEVQKLSKQRIVIALLVMFTITVWASAFPAIKVSLEEYTPVQMACFRYLVASLVMVIFAIGRVRRRPKFGDCLRFLFAGALGISLYNVFVGYGEMTVPAGVTSLIVSTSPLFAGLFAQVHLRERPGVRGWIGLMISLTGAAVIALSNGGSMVRCDLAMVALLFAALLQGVSIVVQKPLFLRFSVLEVAAYTVWSSSLVMLPFASSLPEAVMKASVPATIAVAYLGVAPAALGILAWSFLLARIPASRAAGLLYLVPVASLVESWVWLGEIPAVVSLAGGALSIAGVAFGAKSGSQEETNVSAPRKLTLR